MDQPGLDSRLHRQALRGLGRINLISATARHFWPAIEQLSNRLAGRPVRVLDVACAGGDVAIKLSEIARRRGVAIEVRGCDLSPTALGYARESADRRRAKVGFFEHDVLENRLPECDVIVCSLFLHHLSDSQAMKFLDALRTSAGWVVQVSDLMRSPLGYAFAMIGCRLLTLSKIVHTDGPRSVEAAFTFAEAAALVARSSLRDASMVRHFPQRFHLTWRPS